jgi:hypothetical protein
MVFYPFYTRQAASAGASGRANFQTKQEHTSAGRIGKAGAPKPKVLDPHAIAVYKDACKSIKQ